VAADAIASIMAPRRGCCVRCQREGVPCRSIRLMDMRH
jgi:hypothetical protein